MGARDRSALIPLNFTPDLDPSWGINPGCVLYLNNYVPTKRGTYINFANGPNQDFSDAPTWALATYGTPVTGYVFKAVSGAAGAARMFVCSTGSKRRLIELTSAFVVTDRSKGGADYSASTTNWTMTNQGNAIIACNYYDNMQVSTGAAFADMGGGSPKAQVCCANLGFVMVGNYDDGVNQYGDGWWCSALGNYASWTASLSTQAANGRLLDTPGPIRALVALRDSIIAYKDDSIYIGDYVGDTVNGIIWGWRVVSNCIGCASPHGIAVLNNVHYFLHKTDVYSFDGTQVTSIGNVVQREYLRQLGNLNQLPFAQAGVDELEGVIYLAFSITGTSLLTNCLMLNVNTGKFGGCANGSIWHEVNSANAKCYGIMHAGLGDMTQWESSGSWPLANGAGNKGFGQPVFIGSEDAGTNAELRIPQYGVTPVNGTAGDAYFYTGWLNIGPAKKYLRRVWMRLLYLGTQVATPVGVIQHAANEGANVVAPPSPAVGTSVTNGATWNSTDYAFDCTGQGAADRALLFQSTFRGPHEIGGVWLELANAGDE